MHKYNVIERGKPIQDASRAMIMLHARGGTAEDILAIASRICDDTFYIVAPQATNNSWYPERFIAEEKLNEPWLSSAVQVINRVIDETAKIIPRENIYLSGFSQGACLSLEVTARHATKYGGVIAFSGGLIGHTINEKKYHGNYDGTPIFIGVSEHDPHIPLVRSQESALLLKKMGAEVTLKAYPGTSHIITTAELNWAKTFLQ